MGMSAMIARSKFSAGWGDWATMGLAGKLLVVAVLAAEVQDAPPLTIVDTAGIFYDECPLPAILETLVVPTDMAGAVIEFVDELTQDANELIFEWVIAANGGRTELPRIDCCLSEVGGGNASDDYSAVCVGFFNPNCYVHHTAVPPMSG